MLSIKKGDKNTAHERVDNVNKAIVLLILILLQLLLHFNLGHLLLKAAIYCKRIESVFSWVSAPFFLVSMYIP